MVLIDTHCHLDGQYFPDGPQGPIDRAMAAGVAGFMVIGVGKTMQHARDAIAIAKAYPSNVTAAVGIHPHDASTFDSAAESELNALGRAPEVSAIGEAGLDYHYDNSPRDVQRDVFARAISLAKQIGKPLVVHTRSAAADTLDLLASEGARDFGGIIHCFSEDRAFANRALDLGFYISFSGIVTFKNATSIHDAAASVPLDRLLVETDSPYLAPIPFRGKPCEPAMLLHTARRVAELRGMTLEALACATTANAERLLRRTFATPAA
jgi:TatD DNase family protein